MESVRYFVPTRGRTRRQLTIRNLPDSLRRSITIVCPPEEADAHREFSPGVDVYVQPDYVKTIGQKREFIYKFLVPEYDVEFAWQLDDDLIVRHLVDGRFVRPKDMEKLGRELGDIQRFYSEDGVQVLGLGTSYFAPKGGFRDNYHLGFAFGFSRSAIDRLKMNRLDVFEDIDFTLQMLRCGVRTRVCYDVVVDQVEPDAPGGVSGERDQETIRRDLARLIDYHKFIVYEKPLRPGAHPAAITRVQWKKAAREGGLL